MRGTHTNTHTPEEHLHSPPNIPIQPSRVDFIFIVPVTHIQHRRPVREFLQQLPLAYIPVLVAQVIQIHIIIPRRHDELRGLWCWRELERGDGI